MGGSTRQVSLESRQALTRTRIRRMGCVCPEKSGIDEGLAGKSVREPCRVCQAADILHTEPMHGSERNYDLTYRGCARCSRESIKWRLRLWQCPQGEVDVREDESPQV
jgi:hypothetical protein